ncbi:hypothetical protein CAPTEDRAFT_201023 [Capitella teleta]|uniref:Receptor ligand binding region domain-containing protein n=1 Tax=Capitella teleta TaxID=283909 RepID=R7UB01_CAPTE|nr:hypothetical protein CAPTEDRAFT_201023 [Capitella teleta]|eukprot:ELU03535.1 hypothetical protein CAPTEDRAFT_201023 [Capitella teleta]
MVAHKDWPYSAIMSKRGKCLVYGSGACSVIEGVDSIMRLKEEEGVDVVIGGLCSSVCVPAGYNLRYWNIPYFPASCSNPDMADKNKFPTLARVMPSYNKLGGAFCEYHLSE